VIRRDMSLVGPRTIFFTAATYQAWHYQRLDAGRGCPAWGYREDGRHRVLQRLRLGITYQRQRSLWLDPRILLVTFLVVGRRTGV
jgi:lipopolysaccharide/colanic/teichoic acid biosynthesis glycosyltransferase